ncbi:hypothetical protein Taro_019211, partial [Colocasia esculenta]|nr:hypothetical protein [Colocasia esculenta]
FEVVVPVVRRCFSRGCSVSLVVTLGCSFSTSWSGCVPRCCFHILFDSAGSAGVVFGTTLFLLLWLVRDWLSLLRLVREAHPPTVFSVVAVFACAEVGFVLGLPVRVGSSSLLVLVEVRFPQNCAVLLVVVALLSRLRCIAWLPYVLVWFPRTVGCCPSENGALVVLVEVLPEPVVLLPLADMFSLLAVCFGRLFGLRSGDVVAVSSGTVRVTVYLGVVGQGVVPLTVCLAVVLASLISAVGDWLFVLLWKCRSRLVVYPCVWKRLVVRDSFPCFPLVAWGDVASLWCCVVKSARLLLVKVVDLDPVCGPVFGQFVMVARLAVSPMGVLALCRCFLFRVRRRPVVCLLPLLSVGCSGWWCFHMAFGAMSRTMATFVAKASFWCVILLCLSCALEALVIVGRVALPTYGGRSGALCLRALSFPPLGHLVLADALWLYRYRCGVATLPCLDSPIGAFCGSTVVGCPGRTTRMIWARSSGAVRHCLARRGFSTCVFFDWFWVTIKELSFGLAVVSVFLVGLVRTAPVELSTSSCVLRTSWGALCELVDVWFGTPFVIDLTGCCGIQVGRVLVAVWVAVAIRREVFFLPSPAVELGGAADGSCGAWSVGKERGGGGLGVVKALCGSVLPKSVGMLVPFLVVVWGTPGCSILEVCLPADVATAEHVTTSEKWFPLCGFSRVSCVDIDCCFYNLLRGAVCGGTRLCSSMTSWSVRGAGWFYLWALNLVESSLASASVGVPAALADPWVAARPSGFLAGVREVGSLQGVC